MARVELVKQLWRARSLAALAALAAVPLVAGIATASHAGSRNGTQGGLYGAAPFSALNHVAASLAFCAPLLLALVAALFGSALGAADRDWGTLRYLYVQPVTPRRLITGKFSALALCTALATGLILLSGLLVGLVVFGWHPFHRLGAPALSAPSAALRLVAAAGYATICALSAGSVAFALALVLPGAAEALAASIGVILLATILNGQARLVTDALPVHAWQRWTGLLEGGHSDLAGGLALQLATIVLAMAVAWGVSRRRDPAA